MKEGAVLDDVTTPAGRNLGYSMSSLEDEVSPFNPRLEEDRAAGFGSRSMSSFQGFQDAGGSFNGGIERADTTWQDPSVAPNLTTDGSIGRTVESLTVRRSVTQHLNAPPAMPTFHSHDRNGRQIYEWMNEDNNFPVLDQNGISPLGTSFEMDGDIHHSDEGMRGVPTELSIYSATEPNDQELRTEGTALGGEQYVPGLFGGTSGVTPPAGNQYDTISLAPLTFADISLALIFQQQEAQAHRRLVLKLNLRRRKCTSPQSHLPS